MCLADKVPAGHGSSIPQCTLFFTPSPRRLKQIPMVTPPMAQKFCSLGSYPNLDNVRKITNSHRHAGTRGWCPNGPYISRWRDPRRCRDPDYEAPDAGLQGPVTFLATLVKQSIENRAPNLKLKLAPQINVGRQSSGKPRLSQAQNSQQELY